MDPGPLPDSGQQANPFGKHELVRSLGCLYLAGAALGLASLLTGASPTANVPALGVVVAVAAGAGALLLLFGARLPHAVLSASVVLATAIVSTAVVLDGHSDSVYGSLYVWVVVEAWCFLTRREALVHFSLAAVAYASALIVLDGAGVPAQRWILTIGVALVAGVLVSLLRDRIVVLLDRLSEAARTDPLTHLPNRRAFNERFEVQLNRARERGTPLTVVIGDLDGFKLVNDRLGHHAGDEALCRLSRELETWKRRGDFAARLGGEEFALLLPSTDEREALPVVERIRSAVRDAFGGFPEPLTISFGIAAFPVHGDDAPAVLRAADQALYGAKELGRDRTVLYSPELAESLAASGARAAEGSEMQLATVIGLAEALDIRDTGTARHSRTVGRYAGLMAAELGLDRDRVQRIRMAGMIHDVGKIGISDRVLTKAAPLDRGVGPDAHASPDRRATARPSRARRPAWVGARAPRAPRRAGLPVRPPCRAHRARVAHPRRGRRLRGDDGWAGLPRGARPSGRPRGAARGVRDAVRRRGRRRAATRAGSGRRRGARGHLGVPP